MIRQQAAIALGKIGGEKAVAALMEAFSKEKEDIVKGQIINGIGETRDPSKFDFLIKLFQNNEF